MTHPTTPTETLRPERQATTAGVVVFCALSIVLAWLIALPLWIYASGEPILAAPSHDLPAAPAPAPTTEFILLVTLTTSGMMLTPAIAAFASALLCDRVPFRQVWGYLGMGKPVETLLRRRGARSAPPIGIGRVLTVLAVGLFGTYVLVALVALIALLCGFLQIDPSLRMLRAAQMQTPGIPLALLAAISLVGTVIASFVPNGLLALGEEIGWRGYLQPALMRLGAFGAVAVTGLLWGLWHAPLLLLGYNYGFADARAVIFMVIACIAIGSWFGWLRLHSGGVWAPALAHGALNAAASAYLLVAVVVVPHPAYLATALGPFGWLAFGAAGLLLLIWWRTSRRSDLRTPQQPV